MKLVIVTDAWHPQINGVVTTMTRVVARARQRGFQVELIDPSRFTTVPCPKYENEIRLAVDVWRIVPMLKQAAPDCVHIVSEGPLGLAARLWLSFNKIPYTSAYHTRFPEYVHNLWPFLSVELGYRVLRRFHAGSHAVFVATASLCEELAHAGFDHLRLWSRGVDAEQFHPRQRPHGEMLFGQLPRPWFVYVGRVAQEKNLQAFLQLDLPGSKIIVGDGPAREMLQRQFPAAHFTGFQSGITLAGCFAAADVFVFPSRTDTFGVVLLEAMASGTPVAAFPVTGPKDVVVQGKTGFLAENLAQAALQALQLKREDCRRHATQFTWERAADMLLNNLAPIPAGKVATANLLPLPGLE